jgi:general secretion pathway protein G
MGPASLPAFSDDSVRLWHTELVAHERHARRRWLRLAFQVALVPTVLSACVAIVAQINCNCAGEIDTARNQAFEIGKSVELYKLQQGRFPAQLVELTSPPKGKPIMERLPTDPWGEPFLYVIPGRKNPAKFDVRSKGEDGVAYTDDDKGNWPDGE